MDAQGFGISVGLLGIMLLSGAKLEI